MKIIHDSLPPEQTVTDLAHLAWCSIVALRTAQQDGQARSALTTHTFLMRWLTTAQKQRRFPRSVANDIERLLQLGNLKGPGAGVLQRLEAIWQLYTTPAKPLSDLYRLAGAINLLKSQGWVNAVITDAECRRGSPPYQPGSR